MDFRRFHRNIPMLLYRVFPGKIPLKGMSAFMGNHIHVPACSVKIGKNKRRTIFRQECHIAPRPFRLSSKHIKQLVIHHKGKKLLCFRGHLLIHPPPFLYDFLRLPHRSRISVPEIYPGIYIGQLIQPKAFSPSFMHLLRKRNKIFLNLPAVIIYHRFIIAIAVHPVIAKLHVVLVPHLFCLLRPVLHQLIIYFIQFIRNRCKKSAVFLICLFPDTSVTACEVRAHQR